MCSPAFSWSINKNGKLFYKDNVLSHSTLSAHFNLPDDSVIKAEYFWWLPFQPERIVWQSRPFDPSDSILRNSMKIISKFFHNRDTTFEWVKNNFSDQHVPDKFIEAYPLNEVIEFFNKYRNELSNETLYRIVKYTVNGDVADTVFRTSENQFTPNELFYISRFSNNALVRSSAFFRGLDDFNPDQLAKICLTSQDKTIVEKAFEKGIDKFSIENLAVLSMQLISPELGFTAFQKGMDKFDIRTLSRISMQSSNFKVRNEAEKIYNIQNPRMDY